MLIVGLTGGIGSGKSTVANLFAKLGVPIIDTDHIARELSETNKSVAAEIRKKFGAEVVSPSGELDRRKLRDIIFSNDEKRKQLEEILHPLIREEISRTVKTFNYPYCIVVIPLLFEKDPNPLINRILVVDTLENLQISRTRARDNVDDEHVQAIMKSQVKRSHRLEKANDVIVNDKKIEDLRIQVKKLHDYYLAL